MTNHKLKLITTTCLGLWAAYASGSTFIGNGGNAGDLDLSITLGEIHDTYARFNFDEDKDELCECPDDVTENELCKLLRAMSKPQVKFCQNMYARFAKKVAELAAKNSNIKFVWSKDPLKAETAGHGSRDVDAVAQAQERQIILHTERFLELPHTFRIALITHELWHLVLIDGNYISDEQAMDPFKDGKAFLDVMGAATAMHANEINVVQDFRSLNDVSRAYKTIIAQMDFKDVYHGEEASEKMLKGRHSSAVSLTLEYKPERAGFRLLYENVKHNSKPFGGIKVTEDIRLMGVGVGYHWFPVTTFLSRWSETHFSLFADALYGTAHYRISDSVVALKDRGNVLSGQLTGQVHLPFIYGLWGVLGYQARYLQYAYKDLGLKQRELQQLYFLGVAYGF